MVWPAIIGAAAGLLGGVLSRDSSRSAANRNTDLQREFAQQGIRWKVADAKAAGIHPLYALGASTHSYAPAYVGDTSLGSALGAAGQDVSRAVEATRTGRERHEAEAARFMLERARESDLRVAQAAANARADRAEARADAELASRLANDEVQRALWLSQAARNAQQRGPGMPESVAPGVAASGAVKVVPSEVTSRAVGDPHVTAGVEPSFIRTEVAPGVPMDVLNPKVHQDPGEVIGFLGGASAYIRKWLYEQGASPEHYRGALAELSRRQYEQRANWGWPGYQRRKGR